MNMTIWYVPDRMAKWEASGQFTFLTIVASDNDRNLWENTVTVVSSKGVNSGSGG
jgi:hypothetical protein